VEITWIDTHAHIHDKAFSDDRDAVVGRMREAGVRTAITVGCDIDDSARARETANQFGVFASVGIHPHEAKDAPDDIAAAFEPFLRDPRVVAIGETGLDYFYRHSEPDAQQRVLRAQIRLARERGYPVIFHHRDAFEDFAAILRSEWSFGLPGVVHCFTGDTAQARMYVEEFGLLLGIGGVLTFKTAQPVRDAVAAVGVQAIVLETDCPYLAPVPHRGTRNEPSFLIATAQACSEALRLPVDEIAAVTTANARRLFKLAEPLQR
jgi:TatD DNase family protein